MATRQRVSPPAVPSRSAGYATPTRRTASASPAPSSSSRWTLPLRTPLLMRRTTAAASTATPPSTARRKPRPQWNEYLTDDAQYRLTQERQLVRHMQQLSAAHFHARSPARRREGASRGLQSIESSSDSHTSGYSDTQTPQSSAPEAIQGELSRLENMLSDLEQESVFLQEANASQVDEVDEGLHENGHTQSGLTEGDYDGHHSNSEEQNHQTRAVEDELDDEPLDGGDETSVEGFEDPVASICFQSLRIGMDLTHKMQQLARELDHERRHRKKHERRIVELEQQRDATETRCRVVEAQYDDVSSQLDGMRDAMIATEEAIHRLTQELLRSRQTGSATATQQKLPTSSQPQRHQNARAHASFYVREDTEDTDDATADKENRRVTVAQSRVHDEFEWS